MVLMINRCPSHYNDAIMSAMASRITSLTIVYSIVYSGADQRKHQATRHWPLWGEFTGDGEFPAQRASNAENVLIWWRHHEMSLQPGLNSQVGRYSVVNMAALGSSGLLEHPPFFWGLSASCFFRALVSVPWIFIPPNIKTSRISNTLKALAPTKRPIEPPRSPEINRSVCTYKVKWYHLPRQVINGHGIHCVR